MATNTPAFALGTTTSTFTPTRVSSAITPVRANRARTTPNHATVTMAKKPFFSNPFKANPQAQNTGSKFVQPQAGDPGYKAPPSRVGMQKLQSATSKATTAAEKAVTNLPVVGGMAKRGIDLLREDMFKSAPERAGVGRQDVGAIMKPMAGEPGYKAAAFQTVKVSELGISPFPDDKNAVGKVGGVKAVQKAALEVQQGQKQASQIKKELLNMKVVEEPETYDIPDYLKPLPEDTPKYTWKNYVGR